MSCTPVGKWKPPELIYSVGRYFGSLAKVGELAEEDSWEGWVLVRGNSSLNLKALLPGASVF